MSNKLNPNRRATHALADDEMEFSYEGNLQARKNEKQELFELTVASMYGNDSFYESTDTKAKRLESAVNKLVKQDELNFVANTVVYARSVMNMRSMPIMLAVLFTKALRDNDKNFPYTRSMITDVIQRADQINDTYAVALAVFGNKNKIPMSIKRGVADAFGKFDEYNFAKYDRKQQVQFRDVIRLVHPKPKDESRSDLFRRMIEGELETPYTWETELSRNGQLPASERKSDKQIWTELVTSERLPYMALLRNLRNIAQAGLDSDVLKAHVYDRLSDPDNVAKSKQLPFRFIEAYKSLEQAGVTDPKMLQAVSRAADHSVSNIPQIGDNVWLVLDGSASMTWAGGGGRRGNGRKAVDIAAMFTAALAKANKDAMNVAVTMFSSSAKNIVINPDDSVISITNDLIRKTQGGGTNLQSAAEEGKKLNFTPDTVVLLSDMQVDDGFMRNDARNFGSKNALKVALNLESYQTTPVGEIDSWYQLAGWSERLFDFIPTYRNQQRVVDALSTKYLGQSVKQLNK